VGLGDLRFEREDAAGRALRVGVAGELQELRDIGLIFGLELGHLRVGAEIIFALG
jgi:hypothetical protein